MKRKNIKNKNGIKKTGISNNTIRLRRIRELIEKISTTKKIKRRSINIFIGFMVFFVLLYAAVLITNKDLKIYEFFSFLSITIEDINAIRIIVNILKDMVAPFILGFIFYLVSVINGYDNAITEYENEIYRLGENLYANEKLDDCKTEFENLLKENEEKTKQNRNKRNHNDLF